MKKIMVLLTILLVLGGCSQKPSDRETFTVGMECNYAPYNWTQSDQGVTGVAIEGGQYCEGYDVQIAKLLAEDMNKDLVIRKITWEGLILSTQTGQIDAIIAGMSPTDERKQEITFSEPYYIDSLTEFGIVVKRDGPFADGQGLDGFKDALVTAQVGTFHPELLAQLNGVQVAQYMQDFGTMIVSLGAGEIDGFISDNGTGDTINYKHPDLKYIPINGETGFELTDAMVGVSVGMNKTNYELHKEVNEALSNISAETQADLMDKAVHAGDFSSGNFFEQITQIISNNYPAFIRGTITTLVLSITATLIGFFIALLIAVSRGSKVTNAIANVYVTFFRGTPMMVQAMVMFYGVSVVIPGFRWSNLPMGNLVAGIVIVSINTGAYMAETVRGGIQAIDSGQFEAATSLGFTKWETMRHIILPQAIKNAIPALGNELIVNVKDTSVLNIIGVSELFFVSSGIASSNYQIMQTFTITSAIYLFLTTILSIILRFVEMRLDKTKTRPSTYPTSMTDADNMA